MIGRWESMTRFANGCQKCGLIFGTISCVGFGLCMSGMPLFLRSLMNKFSEVVNPNEVGKLGDNLEAMKVISYYMLILAAA